MINERWSIRIQGYHPLNSREKVGLEESPETGLAEDRRSRNLLGTDSGKIRWDAKHIVGSPQYMWRERI